MLRSLANQLIRIDLPDNLLDDDLIYRRLFFVERSQRKPSNKKINPFERVTSVREHCSMLFIPDTVNEVNPVIQMEKLPNFRVQ